MDNRVFINVKETGSGKTVTVPMNMSKPNKTRVDNIPPLTPPEEKRSVSFDLSVKTLSIPKGDINYYNGFATSPAESIDISVRDCSEEILVSLKERDTEMRELVVCNQEFFDTVKQSIFEDEESWKEFQKVLYSKREEIPDCEWMESISNHLSDNPQLLASFKQITGYYESDDDDNSDNIDEDEYDDNDYSYTSESCLMDDDTYVDITPIRNYPHVLENLEKSYPQLFINANQELGKLGKERSRRGSTLGRNHLSNDNPLLHPNVEDHQSSDDSSVTLYDEFKRILVTPRSEMNDFEWETALNEILDVSPSLLEHFYEIIIQEINAINAAV